MSVTTVVYNTYSMYKAYLICFYEFVVQVELMMDGKLVCKITNLMTHISPWHMNTTSTSSNKLLLSVKNHTDNVTTTMITLHVIDICTRNDHFRNHVTIVMSDVQFYLTDTYLDIS